MENPLPPIPPKRYFTIGEVSELCRVKPYVLRYWEQEFTQLKPMKRRGNRRYYQHHEVLLIRRIRSLLYEQGFTISGARNRLGDVSTARLGQDHVLEPDAIDLNGELSLQELAEAAALAQENGFDEPVDVTARLASTDVARAPIEPAQWHIDGEVITVDHLRRELESIRRLLDN
jgi:DNA-binding transcriptional MerR regulator